MREIVLDTETTGLKANDGDRIVEIGCVELVNHLQTGERRQWYLNPEREVPAEVVRVHGLTTEFLADKPKFAEIAQEMVSFLSDSALVIHNAAFDLGFALAAGVARCCAFRSFSASRARHTTVFTINLRHADFLIASHVAGHDALRHLLFTKITHFQSFAKNAIIGAPL